MFIPMLALAFSLPVEAGALPPELRGTPQTYAAGDALPDGGLDPEERAALVEETEEELENFARRASHVVWGEVLTSRGEFVDGIRIEVLTLLVEQSLRGDVRGGNVMELRVPLRGAMSGDARDSYRSVRGYDVLLFVDDAGYLVDEDGMYIMEGGFGFRARDPGHMLRPRMDHDWVRIIDPVADYSVVSLDQVADVLAEVRQGERDGRKRRRRSRSD